jgi:hypothetical protein
VLVGTALVYGSIGLFVSALVKRTQAATVINLVAVIALTVGTTFLFVFWFAMTASGGMQDQARRNAGPLESLTQRPPEALMWLNPFIAQLDVICGTETGFGGTCSIISAVTGPGAVGDQQLGVPRDSYWPRSLAAMGAVSILLVALSVQLVSPTRRWRFHLPRPHRRPAGSDG